MFHLAELKHKRAVKVTARRCFGSVFLDFDDLAVIVLATVGANHVRQVLCAAGAVNQVAGLQGIMGAAAITATL
jgi:hypothetical protein